MESVKERLLKAIAFSLPRDIKIDDETGMAVLNDEQLQVLSTCLDAFEISIPPVLPWKRLADLLNYLQFTLGLTVKAYFRGNGGYNLARSQGRHDLATFEYLDALISGDRPKARKLAAQLDIANSCPPWWEPKLPAGALPVGGKYPRVKRISWPKT